MRACVAVPWALVVSNFIVFTSASPARNRFKKNGYGNGKKTVARHDRILHERGASLKTVKKRIERVLKTVKKTGTLTHGTPEHRKR